MAGALQTKEVAGQTIMRNVGLYTFMIPVGFMGASNFFVGKYIGLNRVDLAKRMSNYCLAGGYIWSILSVILVWFFKQSIITFYTKDDVIYSVLNQAWVVFTAFVFFDCM